MAKATDSRRGDQHPPDQGPVLDGVDVYDDCEFDCDCQKHAKDDFSGSCLEEACPRFSVVLKDVPHHVVDQMHSIPYFDEVFPDVHRLDTSNDVSQRQGKKFQEVVEAGDAVTVALCEDLHRDYCDCDRKN